MPSAGRVLTINVGSSSLKCGVYDAGQAFRLLAGAEVERIGTSDGRLLLTGLAHSEATGATAFTDHAAALRAALARLDEAVGIKKCQAASHRVVHGGRFHAPQVATEQVLAEVRRLVAIDPVHLPQALAAIDVLDRDFPRMTSVLCFDTAFHQTMPIEAQMYALPRRFWAAGLRRYGFHGLSCEFILSALRGVDPSRVDGRLIIAHLGNGASMTAVFRGASVETTMGFSPTGGLVMGTRPGDLDPGAVLQLLRLESLGPDAATALLNNESGLRGVSETSADMRDLLAREASDPRAAEAIALFCHAAKQAIGRLVATLGGLDLLVFTAGIGEHAAPIRARICTGLECFGLELDPALNAENRLIVSTAASRAVIRVIHTDEDLMLAQHASAILSKMGADHV